MIDKDGILREAQCVCELLINRYCGTTGILCEKVNCSTGETISTRALVDEWGDYVQNVAYLGLKINEPRYINWARNQIYVGTKYCQMPSGLFYTSMSSDTAKIPYKTNLRPVFSLNNADTIIGLVALFELFRDENILQIINKFYDGVFNHCMPREGYVSYWSIPKLKFSMPLSAPEICGNLIEELINLYNITGKKEYVKKAEILAQPWIHSNYFKEYGLFSRLFIKQTLLFNKFTIDCLFKIIKSPPLDTAILMKSNTHVIFGLLALYRVTKDANLKNLILKWRLSIEQRVLDGEGFFYHLWRSSTQKAESADLEHNHSIIEALLDIYRDFNDEKSLELAKNCADFWLKSQNKQGLYPKKAKRTEKIVTVLDPQVDFNVDLLKLYEVTNEREYLDKSILGFQGIMKYHKLKYGYAWSIDYKTSKIIEDKIETKFLGLYIKGLLVLYEVLNGEKLFENSKLRNLARDR